jgi:hypothetical protein
MAWLGVAVIIAGAIAATRTEGATRAGILGAFCGMGVMMIFAGIRGWTKGRRMASKLRQKLDPG